MKIGGKLRLFFLLVTLLPIILLAVLTTKIINNRMKKDAQNTINQNLKAAWIQFHVRADAVRYAAGIYRTRDKKGH